MNWKKAASILIPTVSILGFSQLCTKFYRYGFARVDPPLTPETDDPEYLAAYQEFSQWFNRQKKEQWWLYSDDPSNRIHAVYLPNPRPTKKAVVIAHGYHGNAQMMAAYAQLFQELGYHVLMPDNRGHGESAGRWINFGWLDRLDYLDWCLDLIDHLGSDCELLLFGVSMGGAITMMMSGEDLPPQVKAIIEDCGYSSLHEQLAYRAKVEFHLPQFPTLPIASLINRIVLGFSLNDVNSLQALAKNTRPIFFIHGEKDDYVPTSMCYKNFAATSAPKEMWIVPNAKHAEAFAIDPEAYRERVSWFLSRAGL